MNEDLVIDLSQVFRSQASNCMLSNIIQFLIYTILFIYLGDSQSVDLMNLLIKEKIATKDEDSILCHDILNEDGDVSENEELSESLMQLIEKYLKFRINLTLKTNIFLLFLLIITVIDRPNIQKKRFLILTLM